MNRVEAKKWALAGVAGSGLLFAADVAASGAHGSFTEPNASLKFSLGVSGGYGWLHQYAPSASEYPIIPLQQSYWDYFCFGAGLWTTISDAAYGTTPKFDVGPDVPCGEYVEIELYEFDGQIPDYEGSSAIALDWAPAILISFPNELIAEGWYGSDAGYQLGAHELGHTLGLNHCGTGPDDNGNYDQDYGPEIMNENNSGVTVPQFHEMYDFAFFWDLP